MGEKQALRKMAMERRKAIPSQEKKRASHQIITSLVHHFRNLSALWLAYRSLPDEVDTTPLFDAPPARIFAPVTHMRGDMVWLEILNDTKWQRGNFGVEEPIEGTHWSPEMGRALVICPVVAFSRDGTRLGWGLGCFDRWLAMHKDFIVATVGLAFACQEFDKLPSAPHDVKMDFIVTEDEVIRCRNP